MIFIEHLEEAINALVENKSDKKKQISGWPYGYLCGHLQGSIDTAWTYKYIIEPYALRTGNSKDVGEDELYDEFQASYQEYSQTCQERIDFIFKDGFNIVENIPGKSNPSKTYSSRNTPIFVSNNSKLDTYGWLGEKESGTRYSYNGLSLFVNWGDKLPDTRHTNQTLQIIKWLLKLDRDADVLNEELVIFANSNLEKNDISDWLSGNSLTSKWTITTDSKVLESGAYDLLVYNAPSETAKIKKSFSHNKPVLVYTKYLYTNKDYIWELFDLQWRYSGAVKTVNNFDSSSDICANTPYTHINTTLENLENKTLNFNHNETTCPKSVGKVTCKEDLLLNDNGKTMGEEFMSGALAMREQLSKLDARDVNIFADTDEHKYMKLALLLSDKYREDISYPMDKVKTDDTLFYKALFADHSIHYKRNIAMMQPDMGNFSLNPEALHTLATTTKTVTITPTKYDNDITSVGLYALPGKTIVVRRLDNSDNIAKIRFNLHRSGSSRIWNENQYERPRFMRSDLFEIEKGKDYHISTPYGGPIYASWKAVSSGAVPFTLEFENVSDEHPFIDDLVDTEKVATFEDSLDNSSFDWVDLKTPFLEIHSLKTKMKEAYTTYGTFPYNGDLAHYLSDLKHYLIVNNLNLCGFSGDDLSLNDNVKAFCSDHDFDCNNSIIHKQPRKLHALSDHHAHCGGGCSGNPYDSTNPITPTEVLDTHEFGHNLQVENLKVYGPRSKEVSNVYFSYYTSWAITNDKNLDKHPTHGGFTRNKKLFNMVQGYIANNTPAGPNHPLWVSSEYNAGKDRNEFYMQIVYIHNSWDIITKLYLIDRLFKDATKDDTKWANNKDKLGFSSYTRAEAKAIARERRGQDFMAITLSKFTDKDHRDYFDIWGIGLTDKAKAQIETNGYSSSVPRIYYKVIDDKIYRDFPSETRPLDGNSTYD